MNGLINGDNVKPGECIHCGRADLVYRVKESSCCARCANLIAELIRTTAWVKLETQRSRLTVELRDTRAELADLKQEHRSTLTELSRANILLGDA